MKRINLSEIENIPETCKTLKVYSSKILPPKGYAAITLHPFIIVRGSEQYVKELIKSDWGKIMLNHERIHELQVSDLGIIKFYALYIYYYLVCLFKCADSQTAYYNIPFEREAYKNETDYNYSQSKWYCYVDDAKQLNNNELRNMA